MMGGIFRKRNSDKITSADSISESPLEAISELKKRHGVSNAVPASNGTRAQFLEKLKQLLSRY